MSICRIFINWVSLRFEQENHQFKRALYTSLVKCLNILQPRSYVQHTSRYN